VWQDHGRDPTAGQTLLRFVTIEGNPKEWAALPQLWNLPQAPEKHVRIKVPRGLDDPTGYIPDSNPPTLAKWQLGRELFHATNWLDDSGQLSCARCHNPAEGFSDGRRQSAWGKNAPTLENIVYARSLFHDGRATHLEEVVQQRPEDEQVGRPHAWPGVLQRLRASSQWNKRFLEVFEFEPTQDAVGQALATYQRTLLSGDSLVDRARGLAGGVAPEARHFEPLLDRVALVRLDRADASKAVVAADLAQAWKLFHGPAGCVACHPSGNTPWSDGRYHNIGIDGTGEVLSDPPRQGRFRVAPLGEKNRFHLGAWRTPTLRSLTRTGPYFHNGEEPDLRAAIRRHVQQEPIHSAINNYLAPRLANPDGSRRKFDISENDLLALTTLLKALEGGPVEAAVAEPVPQGTPQPTKGK
jgi:cytochrome c peroxidase